MNVVAEQLQAAVQTLRAYGAKRVLLFGSYLETPERARDLDLAVEGIPLRRLLDADVAVDAALGVPYDLVSREGNPGFYDVIKNHAKVLYDEDQTA